MSNSLNTLKGLLVAAHENVAAGNREVASNLMETALDEMSGMSAEDLEINLQVVPDEPEPEQADNPFADIDEELDDEAEAETASTGESSLYSMVSDLKNQAQG